MTLAFLVTLIANCAMAQSEGSRLSARYDAADWKLWLLDSPKITLIESPPKTAQTRKELQEMKIRIENVDQKKLAEIKYWDAGAPAYRWNQILPQFAQQNQAVMMRMPGAWMNLAIYDATILAWKEKIKYKRGRPIALEKSLKTLTPTPETYSYPCEHSVTAAAAATMIAYFFPEKADSVLQMAREASQSRVDAGVQFPSDVEAGWKLGEAVAKQLIEKAKNDGSTRKFTGELNTDPKKWTGKFALGITFPLYTSFLLRSADQFRPGPPPDFRNEMKELKDFQQTFKSKVSAYYWASRNDIWTDLASKKMFEYRLSDDAPTVAMIYAVLSVGYREMAIAVFDAKYAYWGIRPTQYDTTYQPLISTPPFPGYPSGHAAGAGTASTILTYFFPHDASEFEALAQDCAESRFYAGIHFRSDNETALLMGRNIGKYVVETWMNESKSLAKQ